MQFHRQVKTAVIVDGVIITTAFFIRANLVLFNFTPGTLFCDKRVADLATSLRVDLLNYLIFFGL